MAMAQRLMTAQDLWELPQDGQRHWLIAGELHTMTPSGANHGRHVMHLSIPLGSFVYHHDLGAVYAAETGFQLAREPDTVLGADLAFVRKDRVEPLVGRETSYFEGHPDLAVEVVSPNDTRREVADKVEVWLAHGTPVVLVIEPRQRQVTLHRPGAGSGQRERQSLAEADDLVIDDLLPGWSLPVASLFADRPALAE